MMKIIKEYREPWQDWDDYEARLPKAVDIDSYTSTIRIPFEERVILDEVSYEPEGDSLEQYENKDSSDGDWYDTTLSDEFRIDADIRLCSPDEVYDSLSDLLSDRLSGYPNGKYKVSGTLVLEFEISDPAIFYKEYEELGEYTQEYFYDSDTETVYQKSAKIEDFKVEEL